MTEKDDMAARLQRLAEQHLAPASEWSDDMTIESDDNEEVPDGNRHDDSE